MSILKEQPISLSATYPTIYRALMVYQSTTVRFSVGKLTVVEAGN